MVLWILLTCFGFRLLDSHHLRCAFPYTSPNLASLFAVLTPIPLLALVWPLSLSLATTRKISVDFFSSPYLDVSVQAVPLLYLFIQYRMTVLLTAGFLHSDSCGSLSACDSPQYFAAYRVLLRLLMPRHSLCALSSLTFFSLF